jgi:hypothetical protein
LLGKQTKELIKITGVSFYYSLFILTYFYFIYPI